MTKTLSGADVARQIGEQLPDAVTGSDETTVFVRSEAILDAARFLKEYLDFDYVVSISAIDFVDHFDVCSEWEKLTASFSIQNLNVPIIPVSIEKGLKEKEPKFFKRLLNKVHVPASVSFGSLVCD